MRSIVLLAVTAAVALASCGGSTGSKTQAAKQTSAVTTDAETSSASTETFTIPERDTFAEIPEGAEQSFDMVMDAVNKSYPNDEKGSHRLYGYMGEEQIDEEKCYIFAVYDRKKDVHTEVATAAVNEDSSKVYVYNEDTMTYQLLDIPEEPEETTWACTTVPEAEKPSE